MRTYATIDDVERKLPPTINSATPAASKSSGDSDHANDVFRFIASPSSYADQISGLSLSSLSGSPTVSRLNNSSGRMLFLPAKVEPSGM
jgi:hypothetical protein